MAGLKRTDSKGRILKDGESQRKDGTYRYRYTAADGTRHDVYSSRLVSTDRLPPGSKDGLSLREKEKIINRDLEDGIKAIVENKATLNDIFDVYIKSKRNLKEHTRQDYLYNYDKYVRDTIGTKKITAIKYSTVKTYYNCLLQDLGLQFNSVKCVNTLLHPTFNLAIRDGYIRINPSEGVLNEIKKERNWRFTQRHALTIAQQDAFIDFVKNSIEYRHWMNFFTVMLGTGMRIGEAAGLTWDDCDFERSVISVNHSLSYNRNTGDNKTRYHIDSPKTFAGNREIPMLKEVRKALRSEWETQNFIGFNQTTIDGYSGFIFQNSRGNLLNSNNMNKLLNGILKKYNTQESALAEKEKRDPLLIPHISVHSLRHTFCTRYCENEKNLKVIQTVMGHSDISTTMNIYAEATDQKKLESFESLEGKIKIS